MALARHLRRSRLRLFLVLGLGLAVAQLVLAQLQYRLWDKLPCWLGPGYDGSCPAAPVERDRATAAIEVLR